jgi:hypothetical protein
LSKTPTPQLKKEKEEKVGKDNIKVKIYQHTQNTNHI